MGILGDAGGFLGGVSDLGKGLFGSDADVNASGTGTTTTDSTQTERLKLDEEAVQKIIQDVLGGAEGLAGIFSQEQAAGVFDSSTAAQAAGDIASKLVGELAKLTAESETTRKDTKKTTSSSQQGTSDEGLLEGPLGKIGKVFGF